MSYLALTDDERDRFIRLQKRGLLSPDTEEAARLTHPVRAAKARRLLASLSAEDREMLERNFPNVYRRK